MAAVLPPPSSFNNNSRHGILLNPSPSASPYTTSTSLPGTPHLIPSYSSLSSSSSSSDNEQQQPHYFLAPAGPSSSKQATPLHHPAHNRASLPSAPVSPQSHPTKLRSGSIPTPSSAVSSRRIRFAPLPDPRREVLVTDTGKEISLPSASYYTDDFSGTSTLSQDLSGTSPHHVVTVHDERGLGLGLDQDAAGNKLPIGPSLLFSNTPNGIALVGMTPAPSLLNQSSNSQATLTPLNTTSESATNTTATTSPTDAYPSSPSTALSPLSSSLELPAPPPTSSFSPIQSAVSSPNASKIDLLISPQHTKGGKWSKSLFKPLLSLHSKKGGSSTEDVVALAYKGAAESDNESVMSGVSDAGRGRSGSLASLPKSSSSKKKSRKSTDATASSISLPNHAITHVNSRTSTSSSTPTNTNTPPTPSVHPNQQLRLQPRKKANTTSLFSSPTATSLSIFSSNKHKGPSGPSTNGSMLGRSQSADAAGQRRVGAGVASAHGQRPRSAGGPGGVRRGQMRMLNGRVYGARRVEPYVPDEEPEFVEWGYGGMGSVNSTGGGNSIYSKLQSSASLAVGTHSESWGSSNPSSRATSITGSGESMRSFGGSSGYVTGSGSGRGGEEDDDGSGMAWVKRRRELRKEKERLEALEKAEREEQEQENADAAAHGPDPTVIEEKEEDNEHVTTTVALPPIHHHHPKSAQPHSHPVHVLRHTPERQGSADTAKGIPLHSIAATMGESPLSTPRAEDTTTRVVVQESERSDSDSPEEDEGRAHKRRPSDASVRSSGSEDEDDEEDKDLQRRTALGAGVEKISRHKEKSASTSTIHGFSSSTTFVASPTEVSPDEDGVGVDPR